MHRQCRLLFPPMRAGKGRTIAAAISSPPSIGGEVAREAGR